MYFKIKPVSLGRDRFEKMCKLLGFSVKGKPRRVPVTTDSRGVTRFDNLIKGIKATGANQIWVSDITYYRVKSTFYYITLIMDQFTRQIKGYSVSSRLYTEHTTLPALQMAVKHCKNKEALKGMILHSDGGGQYYDKDFKALTGRYGIKNSMCEYAHENPHAERLNRTIKYCYLHHRKIKSLEELIIEFDRTVTLYNNERPHKALNHLSPAEYAKQIVN
jgi:transposase InsO family protein